MARGGGEWTGGITGGGVLSYKRITLLVCFFNILIALFVLRFLYASSLHIYPNNENVVKYTAGEIRKMEESIRIRRSKESVELVALVKKLKHDVATAESNTQLSPNVKHKLVDEILQRLKSLEEKSNATQIREAVEMWRSEKLKEAKELIHGKNGEISTIVLEEAGMLIRALELEWDVLSEEIGFWLPAEVNNEVHDDKPEGEEEPEEILAGRPVPAVCNAELHTDYGGAAVRWGLTHHKESAADCCQACLDQAKRAKPGETRCNIWVYCPSEFGCFSPDIYEHKHQECWLKYAEKPKQNFKDRYSESYRNNHPKAPTIVPWVSGVVTA
uniref:Apple domain-containing protein n=1 Tax=Noccaea caerulescens TaxID=107243 RepID=A0A1J3K027_NOCCA